MPSNAFSAHLYELLADAHRLDAAYDQLRTGNPSQRAGLVSLNRAAVVLSVSAWETYVRELIREAVQALRPPAPPLGVWPALNASVLSLIGNFNTGSAANVEQLVHSCLGLADVHLAWRWENCTSAQAGRRLAEALTYRQQMAHGNPRPIVENPYSNRLPTFIRRLARCTDGAVRDHLVDVLGITDPWPA